MNFKINFLSFFRGLFLRSASIEFRAKIFASMLLAKKKIEDKDYELLKTIIEEIYAKNSIRINILIAIIKEYISMVKNYKSYTLDTILRDIDRDLKLQPRYVKKINFEHLRRIISSSNENDALIQQRIYEFLLSEVEIYSKN